MRYEIRTEIDGHAISVECDERTAWVLQPLWAKQNPEATECRGLIETVSMARRPIHTGAPWADPYEVKRYFGPRP
jgi:hypothetical protein